MNSQFSSNATKRISALILLVTIVSCTTTGITRGTPDERRKAGDLGAAIGGEAIIDNVTVYQLTQSGLALQSTIKGTRYWQDANLNQI